MGSKGGTTQQTTSSSGPPPQVMGEYQALIDRATNVANQPYQPYQGEMVAPMTGQSQYGLGGISQYAGAAQPLLNQAAAGTANAGGWGSDAARWAEKQTAADTSQALGMTHAGAGPVNAEQYKGQSSLQPFMNPYTQDVINATQNEFNNQNKQQSQFLNSANISSGAFGGDRAGVGQSILANQQQLAEAPTIAGLNQANYTQAMQNWQQQQGVNLAAQQANAQRMLAAGNQYGQLGQNAAQLVGNVGLAEGTQQGNLANQLGQVGLSQQEAGIQGGQANIQAGMIPQQQQQAIDQAAQGMYQTGQAYPFTTTGWLGNLVEGVGGQSGGTSQTTSPGPNALSQGLGAATSGIGLLGSIMGLSDVRAKENVEEIGKTYDGQNIYRYNFKGDPRTQIGLIAQEEAYRHPGSVQRIGMGDLLGIDYRGATEDAAERGHFARGGAADVEGEFQTPYWPGHPLYPGPLAQKPVTYDEHGNPEFPPVVEPEEQKWGGGRVHFAAGGAPSSGLGALGAMAASGGGGQLSPQSALMYMGDPGARTGLGTLTLAGGADAHPQPGMATDTPPGWRTPTPPPSVPEYRPSSRSIPPYQPPPNAQPLSYKSLPSLSLGSEFDSGGERQSFQSGGGLDQLNPLGTVIGGVTIPPGGPQPVGPNGKFGYSTPGFNPQTDQLNSQAGVAEALFGQESAGSKTPYTGVDIDQLAAIGGGQWMPPRLNSPQPDYGNLQKSPQFGAAEKALAGVYGQPDYTPGSTGALAPPQTAPASDAPAPASHKSELFGLQPSQLAGPSALNPSGSQAFGMATWGGMMSPQARELYANQQYATPGSSRGATMGHARGGRAGFAGGGFPSFTTYQPTANPARNPPTYTALDLSHMFGGGQQQAPRAIQIQRQLQGQARAKAAVQHGIVRPRVIAADPTTGQHHDITPQGPLHDRPPYPADPLHDRPPFGTGPYSPGGLPMRAPARVPLATSPNAFPVGGASPTIPSSRGGGMGYPTFGILPPEAAGTPAEVSGRVGYPGVGQATSRSMTARAAPLEGTEEWNKPSLDVEAPRESAEFSEVGGRPLMAPRLVGADPMGQHTLMSPHSMQALPPPSGDEAPMHTGWDVNLPGIFRGGGQGFSEAQGGRVPRAWGGRAGFDDGGSIPIGGGAGNAMEAPTGTDVNELYSGLPNDIFNEGGGGGGTDLSNVDWESVFGGGGGGEAAANRFARGRGSTNLPGRRWRPAVHPSV